MGWWTLSPVIRARRGHSWLVHAGAGPKGCRWRCFVESTGQRNTTTWPWSTPTADWWPSGASVRTRQALGSCWRCWPRPAIARRRRSRWRSRPRGACWWRACAPLAVRCMRSTRWRWPATGSGMRSQGRNPTTPMLWCWPTSCAPTGRPTGRCRPTPSWSAQSPCWPVPNKTRCGTAPRPITSCGRCCASTTQGCWRRFATPAVESCGPRPARYWRLPPHPPTPPG